MPPELVLEFKSHEGRAFEFICYQVGTKKAQQSTTSSTESIYNNSVCRRNSMRVDEEKSAELFLATETKAHTAVGLGQKGLPSDPSRI